MLRINLLPPYVAERKYGRWVFIGCIILLVPSVLLPLAYYQLQQVTLAQETQQADAAEAGKAKTDGFKTEASTIRGSIGPIKQKLDFVKAVYAYNISWARIYSKLADYSDPKISYSDATIGGTAMNIRAYTPSTADVARYLHEITQDPDFTAVAIDRIPGWGQYFVHKYYLDGKLIGISTISTTNPYAGRAAMAAAAGRPGGGPPAGFGGGGPPAGFGGGGPPPGMGGGGPPAGFGGAPGVGGAAPFSFAGGPGSVKPGPGERVYTVDEVLGDRINPLSPTQRQKVIDNAMQRVVMKEAQNGFDVAVTASLVKGFSPPAMPGSAPAGVGNGPPGGFQGMAGRPF
jgi:hypothetical protein